MFSRQLQTDTGEFLATVFGERGQWARQRSLLIIDRVFSGVLTPDEATEDFFGRESDDTLLICLFILLARRETKVGIRKILVALAHRYLSVGEAMHHITQYKEKYCDLIKRAMLGESDTARFTYTLHN